MLQRVHRRPRVRLLDLPLLQRLRRNVDPKRRGVVLYRVRASGLHLVIVAGFRSDRHLPIEINLPLHSYRSAPKNAPSDFSPFGPILVAVDRGLGHRDRIMIALFQLFDYDLLIAALDLLAAVEPPVVHPDRAWEEIPWHDGAVALAHGLALFVCDGELADRDGHANALVDIAVNLAHHPIASAATQRQLDSLLIDDGLNLILGIPPKVTQKDFLRETKEWCLLAAERIQVPRCAHRLLRHYVGIALRKAERFHFSMCRKNCCGLRANHCSSGSSFKNMRTIEGPLRPTRPLC